MDPISPTSDQTSDPATDPATDRIEHRIYITSDVPTVWDLVARPGWWINDGDVDPDPVLREEGGLVVLEHPEWGEFVIQVVERDEPRYAAYRWRSAPVEVDATPQAPPALGDATTLVELWLEQAVGGVTLTVAESGFTQLSDDPAVAAQQREDNAEGWSNELKAARAFTTRFRG